MISKISLTWSIVTVIWPKATAGTTAQTTVYKNPQTFCVSIVPHEIPLDECEMTGIWSMEFMSSLRSGIVGVVCVCVCVCAVFQTDRSFIEEDSEEGKSQASGFQNFLHWFLCRRQVSMGTADGNDVDPTSTTGVELVSHC